MTKYTEEFLEKMEKRITNLEQMQKQEIEKLQAKLGRPKNKENKNVEGLQKEGLTQKEVAKELNISLSTVRRNWSRT